MHHRYPTNLSSIAAEGRGKTARASPTMTNYVQHTPTGPYKFTIVESRPVVPAGAAAAAGGGAPAPALGPAPPAARRLVGFRENMDIKFLRPHEIIVTRDTAAGGVQAVAN